MTATQLQFRRGTAAQMATFAGAPGEVVVDTTNNRIVVCDGATAGGFPAAKLSEVPALLSYQGSGFVNRFRNGTFDVWQRGASGSVTTSGGSTADGWIVVPTGASLSWQQGAPPSTGGVPPPTGSDYFLYLSGAAGITDVVVKQRIEGSIAAVLAGKQVTVQLAVNSGLGSPPTPTLTVKHPNAQDNFSALTTDVGAVALQGLSPNAWVVLSYTFTAPSVAGNGLEISWDFGALASTALAIGQADIRATPGVATGLNSSPPLPELRPISVETMMCQRHYMQLTASARTYLQASAFYDVSFGFLPMRVTPTANLVTAGIRGNLGGSPTMTPLGPSSVRLEISANVTGDTYDLGDVWSLTAEL